MSSEIQTTTHQWTVRQALKEAAALFLAGNLTETEKLAQQILAVRPDTAGALEFLGLVEYRREHLKAAADLLQQALDLRPNEAEYHSNLAVVLQGLERKAEALEHYRQAVALKPDYPEAHANLGTVLAERGDLEEALSAYQHALRLKPGYAEAHYNFGHAFQDLNRPVEAMAAYRRALELQPDHADARWGLGWVLLLTGDYPNGWASYEGRFQTKMGKKWGGERSFPQPRWQGEPLAGRTLLVHGEQGLGDTLQFCRYVSTLKAHGGPVVLECQPELVRLLYGMPGVERVIARPTDLKAPPSCDFDCYAPLLSLPHVLGTTLPTIPAAVPYLRVEPERVRLWKDWFRGPELRVGLVWAGNPRNPNDRNRSCPLALFAALAQVPGVHYYSLQKGPAAKDAHTPGVLPLTDLGEQLLDFADTAAVLLHLDLVITVDTAVAHLAGALGCPVWTLLPFAPDWRWLMERRDSPWYPTLRLFRQNQRGDWSEVLTALTEALKDWAKGRPRHRSDPTGARSAPPSSLASGLVIAMDRPALALPAPLPEPQLRQGIAAIQAGRADEGLARLHQVVDTAPEWPEAHYNLGVALQSVGHAQEAATAYRRALALRPEAAEVSFNLANALRTLERADEAIPHYQRALALRPDFRKAHTNLGSVLLKQGQVEAAAQHFRRALDLDPRNATAHLNLGTARQRLGDWQEAATCLHRAQELGSTSPDVPARLGIVLEAMGQAEEGIALLRESLRMRPDDAETLHNLAALLLRQHGPTEEVFQHLERAIELTPGWAVAHHSLALALLTAGDFKRGFTEYEWRWRLPDSRPLPLEVPPWDGTDGPGQTVLLWAEQGLGDTIQFVRYASLIAARGMRVVVGCPAPLVRLVKTVPGVAHVSSCVEDLAPFACHAPLLSLPRLLGTTMETVPAAVPYVQVPERVASPLKVQPGKELRVGLIWAGNPSHPDDGRRSCPVECLKPLLTVPGVAFWSLQQGAAAERDRLSSAGHPVRDLSEPLEDFAATAAVVSELDLVISVDTATAHLAGALGKPVWLLLAYSGDWRWLCDRNDSPWYPSMRLYRQPRPGDWQHLLAEVAHALKAYVCLKRP